MMSRTANFGTVAVLAALAPLSAPRNARACSIDAGTWEAPADAGAAPRALPAGGALVIDLTCSLETGCGHPDVAALEGSVRAPGGAVVPGAWTFGAPAKLVFVPNVAFGPGQGYQVDLSKLAGGVQTFDVTEERVPTPTPADFRMAVTTDVDWVGVPGTERCCDDTSLSCAGPGPRRCYETQESPVVHVVANIAPAAGSVLAMDQLELAATWASTGDTQRCIGCGQVGYYAAATGLSAYCLEVSARPLGGGRAVSLGSVCAAQPVPALDRRDTPKQRIPSACLTGSAGVDALDPGAGSAASAHGCSLVHVGSSRGGAWGLGCALLGVLLARLRHARSRHVSSLPPRRARARPASTS